VGKKNRNHKDPRQSGEKNRPNMGGQNDQRWKLSLVFGCFFFRSGPTKKKKGKPAEDGTGKVQKWEKQQGGNRKRGPIRVEKNDVSTPVIKKKVKGG